MTGATKALNPFEGFAGVSPEAKQFIACFAHLTPREARVLRLSEWKALDGNANNEVSLSELERWIKIKLCSSYKDAGERLWKIFRPSYIIAMNEAKAIKPGKKIKGTNASEDDYIEWCEFRLACAFVCCVALMCDCFNKIDGIRHDSRIEKAEWMSKYSSVNGSGFVGLANLDEKKAESVFLDMDQNKQGMVLLAEWCSYLKKTEVEAGTMLSQLMLHVDPVAYRVVQVFKKYDKNGDRRLSLAELKMMVHDKNADSTGTDCEMLFKSIDKDNSGNITFDELYQAIFDET